MLYGWQEEKGIQIMGRLTTVIVDRANYGRLKPLMLEINKSFDHSVICCGSTVLKRFHHPAKEIAMDFHVSHSMYHSVEGSNTSSMINSMAMLMPQLEMALRQNNPDYVLIIGDRFETLAVATVASMMNRCVVHVQGGEQSGNIDNTIRDAVTKLSHYHVPATIKARNRLFDIGEKANSILAVGCPSADIVFNVGIDLDYSDKILCIYHPETAVNNQLIIAELLSALERLNRDVVMLWPNNDPGSEGINKVIRRYIAGHESKWLTMAVNFEPEKYYQILQSVKCCIGNSSSFVRDASFFGTPVVLIGERQRHRAQTKNVYKFSGSDFSTLGNVINDWMTKDFAPSNHFGEKGISRKIVKALQLANPYFLKG